jgi:hypothetical protein
LFTLTAIAGLFWIAGFPLPYLINNHRLNSFAEQLNRIPLPPETQKIGPMVKNFGNLGPCGKHGDYYVGFKINSNLSYSQLREFYDNFNIQVPEINNPILSMFRGLGTHGPVTIDLEEIHGQAGKYLVSAFDALYWHNDFRCW